MQTRHLTLTLVASLALWANAEIPDGYYSECVGLCGRELIEELEYTIADHYNVGYKGLWEVYLDSDMRPDGTIWDMYSTKHWTPKSEQCGSYKKIGDCYNREHSFPKSWFDDASPMYSDAFHIYPTDGKVNGQRSNYPYGECAHGEYVQSHSGVHALGRLGQSTFPGYSGTVFEPDDEYKGDFARSYFYMATCYNRLIDGWHSDMLAGNSYPAFTSWAIDLLLKWHRKDPVSDKERTRQEAIYKWQDNRNPFIDFPELAEHIWGDKKNTGWSPDSPGAIGLHAAETGGATAVAADGAIIITAPEWTDVTIVTLDGIVWFRGQVADNERFEVDPGIYLVRLGSHTERLLVRTSGR